MTDQVVVYRLGRVPYATAWALQRGLARRIAAGEHPPTLLLLEHPHTYTFGRRGHAEHLLWDEAELQRRGVAVFWVDRGGDVTYHGPGQLVGYPLLPLGRPGQFEPQPERDQARLPRGDYVGYLHRLEEVIIQALQRWDIPAQALPGLTGVWVPGNPPAKIAAIGVKVDANGISQHGFALNVNPDMTYWQGIIGCGLRDYPVTSMAQVLGTPPPWAAVMEAIESAFAAVFGLHLSHSRLPPAWLAAPTASSPPP